MACRLGLTVFLLIVVSTTVADDIKVTKVEDLEPGCKANVFYTNGYSSTIDLSPLKKRAFRLNGTDKIEAYELNICTPRPASELCPNDFMAYIKDESGRAPKCEGYGNMSELVVNKDILQLHTNYKYSLKGEQYIPIKCGSDEGKLLCTHPNGCSLPAANSFAFETKYACLQPHSTTTTTTSSKSLPAEAATGLSPKIRDWLKLSPGTIILIAVGVVFVTYMTVGVAHGIGKGAKGLNRLPNSDFWMELPWLVKDGALFVFTCKAANGYNCKKGYVLLEEDKCTPPPPVDV